LHKIISIAFPLFFFVLQGFSQAKNNGDSLHLPFAIADEKRLSDEDLKNKKEGIYVTGVPDLSSDPLNGFGYGGEGSIYFNGKRTDPFYKYTPYRQKIDFTLFNTTKDERELKLKIDVPYIFNTKWRLRSESMYEVNPNLIYFGNTEKSLNGLSYTDSKGNLVSNANYSDYIGSLKNPFYNTFKKEEFIFNITMEHSFFDGKVRALIGYEFGYLNLTTVNDSTLLNSDNSKGLIYGFGKGRNAMSQIGISYDTRDLEPDPANGIFAELNNEYSSPALLSKYSFYKFYFHFNYYKKLFQGQFNKLVFAGRYAMGYTGGDAPFFEYQDQWSSEGSTEGLGGSHTLRGYKQARFLGRVMTFNNYELRYRFLQKTVFKQHLAFSAVPFFDIGGVWDDLNSFFTKNNYRYNVGVGLRIAWDVNTILRFDYAISKEDNQFFFSLGHAF